MSNLGFQYIWSACLDGMKIGVDRLFLEVESSESPRSFETRHPLAEHRLSLWSISFEEDYFHFARMLRDASVPLRASERGEDDLFVLVGGPAVTANPESLALLCDAIVIGDGEPFMEEAAPLLEEFAEGRISRHAFEDALVKIQGVYLPKRVHTPTLHEHSVEDQVSPQLIVKRTETAEVVDDLISSRVITPSSVFSNVMMAEMTRGCGWGCRFCLAGYWYRPVRFSNADALLKRLDETDLHSGTVGLVGACLVDHPELDRVTQRLVDRNINYTTSSLRLELLDEERVDSIVRGGMRTITIAPEAGTERLRRVIRKTMTHEDILRSGRTLAAKGVQKLKLYFMMGLPTESDEDMEGIVSLAQDLKRVFSEVGHHPRLSLSVSPLVPKPWTAFQWKAMIGKEVHARRAKILLRALDRISGVRVTVGTPKETYRQSILSLGDRRVSEALILWAEGSSPTWKRALKDAEVDSNWLLFAEKPDEYRFPWDFVKTAVSRRYLLKEYHRSFRDGGELGTKAWEARQRELAQRDSTTRPNA
jgi:radical SAM superfamily enzyme YgiQ (UPF0313 family)